MSSSFLIYSSFMTGSQSVTGSSATYGYPFGPQLQQQQHFQHRSTSSFNHFGRASYKGECKRLMSRTNVESVAERASRFEEIDFERYNRLKAKYGELDLGQQYGNEFGGQRLLRLGDYRYREGCLFGDYSNGGGSPRDSKHHNGKFVCNKIAKIKVANLNLRYFIQCLVDSGKNPTIDRGAKNNPIVLVIVEIKLLIT